MYVHETNPSLLARLKGKLVNCNLTCLPTLQCHTLAVGLKRHNNQQGFGHIGLSDFRLQTGRDSKLRRREERGNSGGGEGDEENRSGNNFISKIQGGPESQSGARESEHRAEAG